MLAETALASIARVAGGVAKARAVDIICSRHHRLAEVLRSTRGPIYLVRHHVIKVTDLDRCEACGEAIVWMARHQEVPYVDLLAAPSSLSASPMRLPTTRCPCQTPTSVAVDWVADLFRRHEAQRGRLRVIAQSPH